jgi:hypothetical protein
MLKFDVNNLIIYYYMLKKIFLFILSISCLFLMPNFSFANSDVSSESFSIRVNDISP